jgi:hypothetical protein
MNEGQSLWMSEGQSLWMSEGQSLWMSEGQSLWMSEGQSLWMSERQSFKWVKDSPFECAKNSPFECAKDSPFEFAKDSPFECVKDSPFPYSTTVIQPRLITDKAWQLTVVWAVERRVGKHLASHVASSWSVGVTRYWNLPRKSISVLGPRAGLQPNSQNKF